MSAFKPARRVLGSLALVALAVTACGRTEVAVQPDTLTLAPQVVRETFPVFGTGPLDFVNPCNGELVAGTSTTTGEGRLLLSGPDGDVAHVQVRFNTSGTYVGQTTGVTYTESGTGREHVNARRDGAFNFVSVLGGQFTGSDGSTVVFRERTVFVRDANGVVRVSRFPMEADSLSCKQG